MYGSSYTTINWLLEHPKWLIALLVFAVVVIGVWIAAPITWRRGEGSLVDEGEETAFWLRAFFRIFQR
jgi:hypothetical protein